MLQSLQPSLSIHLSLCDVTVWHVRRHATRIRSMTRTGHFEWLACSSSKIESRRWIENEKRITIICDTTLELSGS